MVHFIYNPNSGSGKIKRVLKKLTRYCLSRKVPYAVHPTQYRGHCGKLVTELEREGTRDFAVLGGDGTFHEALNGVTDLERTRLLLVPCGSGNDFVAGDRRLNQSPLALLKKLLTGKTRKIDFIEFDNGVRCLNIAGTGLDIEVLQKTRAMRRITGKPRYLAALKRVLRKFQPYDLSVTANGQTDKYSALLVGICNGRRLGGGMQLSPQSKIDDGKLNVVIIKMVKRSQIKFLLPMFLLGKHIGKYYSVDYLTEEVKIESEHPLSVELDGEIYAMPFSCRIVKNKLTVFC